MADTSNFIGGDPTPEPQYDWQKPQGAQFEIGDVISRSFEMLRRNFLPFAVTALVVIGIPAILTIIFTIGAFGGLGGEGLGMGTLGAVGIVGALLGVLTLIVSSIILPAAIIYASLKGWAGEPVSMRESLRLMLSRFWSLLGLGIVAAIAIGLGFLLLVVPGLILYSGWFVVVPVLIMERKGVFDSLSRSWELTSGYKWQIFAVIVIAFVIQMLIAALFSIPSMAMAIDVESVVAVDPGASFGFGYIVAQLFSMIGDAIAQLLAALFTASAYYELRRVKEGIGISSIASIFD